MKSLSFVFIKCVVISLILQQPQRKQFAPNPNWGPYMSLFWSSQGSGKIDCVCETAAYYQKLISVLHLNIFNPTKNIDWNEKII